MNQAGMMTIVAFALQIFDGFLQTIQPQANKMKILQAPIGLLHHPGNCLYF